MPLNRRGQAVASLASKTQDLADRRAPCSRQPSCFNRLGYTDRLVPICPEQGISGAFGKGPDLRNDGRDPADLRAPGMRK